MIVIGICAMIMAIGIPLAFQVLKKDPMRQAVSDTMEAFSHARAAAILDGVMSEIQFRPRDYSFSVVPGQAAPETGNLDLAPAPRPSGATRFSAQWSDQLTLEMLDVNFQEKKDDEVARVRFFPNGTCDECTIVLQWPDEQQYRKISLDIITGLADVEVIR